MGFAIRGEAVVGACEFDELKLVYRVLHESLANRPELMDTDFLAELQHFLHTQAKADGVDVGDHGAWDRWLGNIDASSCATRVAKRTEISPDKS